MAVVSVADVQLLGAFAALVLAAEVLLCGVWSYPSASESQGSRALVRQSVRLQGGFAFSLDPQSDSRRHAATHSARCTQGTHQGTLQAAYHRAHHGTSHKSPSGARH